MTFIFYDTETTGLEPAFDQILQFAAIVTDDAFNVLEEVNFRCRLQPHVLASPGAMFITKVGPKAIQAAPLSCYEMVSSIRAFIQKWTPTVLIGFNSIGYDEDMLRQAFYQNLHPTYLTNTNGNSRMDVMLLAHAVAEQEPGAIKVPVNDKGKPSFKLSHLVDANGLALDQAHDALADTRATLALAKYLRERAPATWDALFACRSRQFVSKLLATEEIVLFTDRAFRKPTILAGLFCVSHDNPAAHAMFDLSYDPALYLDVDLDRALRLLKSSPRPIRILKANKLPLVRTQNADVDVGVDVATARERLARIKAHPTFATTIAKAMAGQYDDKEPSPYIEQQIYGGFPTPADAQLMERFHETPWPERYALSLSLEDARYREFAERIIHAEHPECIPAERRAVLDEWCRSRLITDGDVPWMTLAKAKKELDELRIAAGEEHAGLVAEIADYLII